VQVYVIHLLVGIPTVVEDGSVAVRQSFIRRDLLRHHPALSMSLFDSWFPRRPQAVEKVVIRPIGSPKQLQNT
jgi:hypothetical protein